jgi:hypothetical protein
MTFEHLTDGDFEELTYDLLASLGFTNLDWRRGSGKGGATADQGRDVVGKKLERDIDGTERHETWFVQCKHYQNGVPPEKLQGAITWATSERPHVLLFVVSNFLSNPAKLWLDEFDRNVRPPFRIKVWERKTLESLLLSQATLVSKYRLTAGSDSSIHPAHLLYVTQPAINTVEYFFEKLERTFDTAARDLVLGFTKHSVINPTFREPESGHETLAELMVESTDYRAFKTKCVALIRPPIRLGQEFVVQAIVNNILAWSWRFADLGETQAAIKRNQDAVEYCTTQLQSEIDQQRRSALEGMKQMCLRIIGKSDQQRQMAEVRYRTFCEDLIPQLYLEDAISDPRSPRQR